jgi:threonine efflux protein
MLSTLAVIALMHWVVLATPGANVLVVSQLAAAGQRKAACWAALGVSVVALIWATLAVLGVNAVFAAHPRLRLALQVAGGLYLCYVAFRLWRAGASRAADKASALASFAAFRLGFVTNILNPKSALFFGSVFATALPADPSAALLVAAVSLVLVNALLWHFFLALAFSQTRVQAVYRRWRKVLNGVACALIGAFGVRLLIAATADLKAR